MGILVGDLEKILRGSFGILRSCWDEAFRWFIARILREIKELGKSRKEIGRKIQGNIDEILGDVSDELEVVHILGGCDGRGIEGECGGMLLVFS